MRFFIVLIEGELKLYEEEVDEEELHEANESVGLVEFVESL